MPFAAAGRGLEDGDLPGGDGRLGRGSGGNGAGGRVGARRMRGRRIPRRRVRVVSAAAVRHLRQVHAVVRRNIVHRPGGLEKQRLADLAHQPVRTDTVRFINYENVGDFHQSGLHRLDPVAGLRHQHYGRRVRRRLDLELGLPHPHGLDHDVGKTEGVEKVDDFAGRRRQPAERARAWPWSG